MPFKSQAQRRLMYAKHPEIAKRWEAEYPSKGKRLPEHVGKPKPHAPSGKKKTMKRKGRKR